MHRHFSQLGPKYIDGTGWNSVGFPSFEVMQFVDNSTPRPATFCSVARGPDHYGTAAYNAAWSKPPGAHQRGSYFINFQDPAGPPTASPLVVNGQQWLKLGWSAYDAKLGYGWAGPNIGNPKIMLYQYVAGAPNELQASVMYDDYGRTDTFNWDIANGRYKVTVSIGWQGKTYLKNRVYIEGKPLFDNVATTPAAPYQVASITVDVTDGNVTMEAGQFNEYTILNWMSIEPAP